MSKSNKFQELSDKIVDLIGGKDNLGIFTHCVTRLRFNIKDKNLVKLEEIKTLPGVVGTQWTGDQLQVIIGSDVMDAYEAICKQHGLVMEKAVDENLDAAPAEKKKFSLKKIGNDVMAYISPIMLSIIPVMIGASMCKTIAILLGPSMINVISDTSDLYIILNSVYNAFFYFLPMLLGYSAAKNLNINPLYGIFLGGIIMAPDFLALVGVRETIKVLGIPAPVANYSQTFLPVILGVFIMSYVLKLFNKIMPKALKPVFVPTLTILVMLPVMFVVCCPLGSYLGTLIGNAFIWMAGANIVIRIIGAVLLGVLLPYMVLTGMHGVLVNFAIMTFFANGFESYILPIMIAYNFAVYGVGLGAIIKLKNPENKAEASGHFVAGFLGGVTEPVLFGTVLRHKAFMKALLIACAFGGIYCGILGPQVYALVSASVFTVWAPWVSGGTGNLIVGLIMSVATFAVGAVAACLVKYDDRKLTDKTEA